MTLTTHAVVGGLLGAVASHNLALAGLMGFASHFIFDTIPHWDYHLSSSHEDDKDWLNNDIDASGKAFIIDLAKIGFDFVLGLVIVYAAFHSYSPMVLLGAIVGALFAIVPDPLQFAYMKWRHEPLVSLQKFHIFMHAKLKLKDRPLIGIASQAIIVIVMLLVATFIIPFN
jgi:hypothetical protein